MTFTQEQIKQLAEAQRDNPALELLRDYDGDKIDVLWVGERNMAARFIGPDGSTAIFGRVTRDGWRSECEYGVTVTDAGREWLRVNSGEWVKAGGKACKVEVRYVAANDQTEMKCTHIDERLRGKKMSAQRFKASNGWEVGSCAAPALSISGSTLWVQGESRDWDNQSSYCYGNYVAAIVQAVNEANAAWEKELATVSCCICGKPVDTSETGNGAELLCGRWACSHECWNKAAGPLNPEADAIIDSIRESLDKLAAMLKARA